MPELPEVETLKRYLECRIIGQKITSVEILQDKLRYQLSNNLAGYCKSQTIAAISRRAKYIYITLSNKKFLVVHLGMSGRFSIKDSSYKKVKHDQFTCPNYEEDWHNKAYKLLKELEETESKRLSELIRQDLDEILEDNMR